MSTTFQVKRCSRCKEIKDIEEFYIRNSSKDGHSYCCKECERFKALESFRAKQERKRVIEERRKRKDD